MNEHLVIVKYLALNQKSGMTRLEAVNFQFWPIFGNFGRRSF